MNKRVTEALGVVRGGRFIGARTELRPSEHAYLLVKAPDSMCLFIVDIDYSFCHKWSAVVLEKVSSLHKVHIYPMCGIDIQVPVHGILGFTSHSNNVASKVTCPKLQQWWMYNYFIVEKYIGLGQVRESYVNLWKQFESFRKRSGSFSWLKSVTSHKYMQRRMINCCVNCCHTTLMIISFHCKIGTYSLPAGHVHLLPHSSSGRSWLDTASAANHIR
jgi:hypothetical protein